jgi:enoyl-CoA hydratase/carnithine racemase
VTYEHIRYAVRDRIATVTLNRPERRNPLALQTYAEICDALGAADADDEVRCVVLTGAGSAFSSGGELGGDPHETAFDWYRIHTRMQRCLTAIRETARPLIAAVNGLCYGSGLILAAHCDFIVASSAARFALIEGRMGLAGAGMIPFLVGPQWAKFLMLSGEVLSAVRARQIGLVLEVVEAAEFAPRIEALARQVAAMPPIAAVLNKRNVNATVEAMGWNEARGFNQSHYALIDAMSPQATAADGRLLAEVLRTQGFRAFLSARDAAFATPWLRD